MLALQDAHPRRRRFAAFSEKLQTATSTGVNLGLAQVSLEPRLSVSIGMDNVGKLLDQMEQGLLIPNLALSVEDIESALNQRDKPHFAQTWMNAFRQIERNKGGKEDADPRVTRLRELAYRQAFGRWHSPDLAAYISDDIGLIGDALAINHDDTWVNGLLDSYLSHQFPLSNQEHLGRLGDDL